MALVASLVCAAAASAMQPAAGARYDGTTKGGPVVIRVSKDGTKLSSYEFSVPTTPCVDGKPYHVGLSSKGERAVPIDPRTGEFSYKTPIEKRTWRMADGRRVTARFQAWFSGIFQANGDIVQGGVQTALSAPDLICNSQWTSFSASRDGTYGAPFQDANIISGRYAGRTSQRLPFEARVFLPARRILTARVGVRYRCRGAGTYSARLRFADLAIAADRSFASSVRVRLARHGYRLSGRARMRGVLENRGRYSLSASVELAAELRRGHGTFRCSARVRIPDATFQG